MNLIEKHSEKLTEFETLVCHTICRMRVVTAADLAIFITKWMALKDDPAVSEKDASGKAWDLVMALHKLTTLGRIRAIEYCTPQGSTKTHFFYLASGARIRLDPDGSWQ